MATLDKIRQSLRSAVVGKYGNLLFRPTDGTYNFVERIPPETLLGALDDIEKKVPIVQAGVDEFTNCEKAMLVLFENHHKNAR